MKLSDKYSKTERPVKDKEANNLMGTEQMLNRWAENVEELVNRPAPKDPQTYSQQKWSTKLAKDYVMT